MDGGFGRTAEWLAHRRVLRGDLYAEVTKLPAYLELLRRIRNSGSRWPKDRTVTLVKSGSETAIQALLHLARILELIRGNARGHHWPEEAAGPGW